MDALDVVLVGLAGIGFFASLVFVFLAAWLVWDTYRPTEPVYVPVEPEDTWNWAGLR